MYKSSQFIVEKVLQKNGNKYKSNQPISMELWRLFKCLQCCCDYAIHSGIIQLQHTVQEFHCLISMHSIYICNLLFVHFV